MLGFSFGELLLVAIVAIIFTDPKDLPEFARRAVRFIRKIKSFGNEFTSVINKEFAEPKSYIKDLNGQMQKTYDLSDLRNNEATSGKDNNVIPGKDTVIPGLTGDPSKL